MKVFLSSPLLIAIILTSFLVPSLPVFSQVKGKVVNAQGEPLPFVNALLLSATDSAMTGGSLSADDGSFRIDNVKSGRYLLQLKLIGFENRYSEAFSYTTRQPEVNLGTLSLREETIVIEGVVVTAQRMQIEQHMEGTTLNVQSSLMSRGSSALQILENSPGVVHDRRNNELMLNGKSGTLIMINGRPVRMAPAEVLAMLQGMSADNLEKVELLTNPSAKYDADGSAGIINLVTKKQEEEGTNGSASVSGGYGWGPKQAVSLSANHRKGPVNYHGSYSFNYDHFFSDFHATGFQTIPALNGEVNFDFLNKSERKRTGHSATAGLEKEFGNGVLLGGNILYNVSTLKEKINNNGNYIFEDDSFLHADILVRGRSVHNNLNASLFSEKRLKNDGKLSFDASYLWYNNDAPTTAESVYLDENGEIINPENDVYSNGNRGESNTDVDIGVLKLDFETKIGPKLKLETGIKGSYSTTSNEAKLERLSDGGGWVSEEQNRSSLEIDEKIGASYLSLLYSPDSLTTINTGLRYEYWDRDFSEEGLDSKFGKFFPSLFLSRTLTPSASLQLVYNRRITRPDYNDLTNFLRYNDPTSVFTGTPELKPAVSENLKLGYQFMDKNVALVYSHELNPIARFQLSKNKRSDLVVIAPLNLDYIRNLGIQAHIPFSITKWWNVSAGGTLSSRQFKISYTRQPVKKDYIAYNLYLNQNFSLPKDFSAELSGRYNSDHYNGSTEVQGFGTLNFGLKKDLKNNMGSIQFTITDVLESTIYRWKVGTLTEEAFDFRSKAKIRHESANARIFRISWSKSFGNVKTKGFRQRKFGAQEERSRIKE